MCSRLGQAQVRQPVALSVLSLSFWKRLQEQAGAVGAGRVLPSHRRITMTKAGLNILQQTPRLPSSIRLKIWQPASPAPVSYLLRQRNRNKYILGPVVVFHGITFLSRGFLPASHHCNSPVSTFGSSNAAVPLVAHNTDTNFLINSSLPKTLQGGMASFHNVKMSMFVACRGQIYSEPEPSSLFHTFKFKGNSVLLWKTRPRSCNKADTDTSITMDAKL